MKDAPSSILGGANGLLGLLPAWLASGYVESHATAACA